MIIVRSVTGEVLHERPVPEDKSAVMASSLRQQVCKGRYFLCTLLQENGSELEDFVDVAALLKPELTVVRQTPVWSPDLLAAARRGDFMAAGRALRAGRADPDSADERGWSALCFGAAAGDESMVRLLHKASADLNLEGPDEQTPLFLAAEQGRLSLVQYLLEHRCDANKVDFYGMSPLQAACGRGLRAVAQALCDARASLDLRDEDGETALSAACRLGSVAEPVVRLLLEQRADVGLLDVSLELSPEAQQVLPPAERAEYVQRRREKAGRTPHAA